MLLFPLLNGIIDTGAAVLVFTIILLGIEATRRPFKEIFAFSSKWNILIKSILLAFFIACLILKWKGIIIAADHRIGEFFVVIAAFSLCLNTSLRAEWDKNCLQFPLLSGLLILAVYLADVALFPGFVALFEKNADTMLYFNMAAFLIFLIAGGVYIYSDDKTILFASVAGMVVSVFVLTVNEAWGTVVLIFALLILHSVVIVPMAEAMKRLLQIFFGLALLFCNMEFVMSSSGVLYVENLKFHLECGVVGELILCFLAVYVFGRWDRIPKDIDLRIIKLDRLQKGCYRFWRTALQLFVILVVISVIDGRLDGNLMQLMAGEQWEGIKGGIFAVTLHSLLSHMYRALTELWTGNLFAVFYQMYGWIGAILALSGMGLIGRRLYNAVFRENAADGLHIWMAAGIFMALLFLPVTVYLLPVYLLFII